MTLVYIALYIVSKLCVTTFVWRASLIASCLNIISSNSKITSYISPLSLSLSALYVCTVYEGGALTKSPCETHWARVFALKRNYAKNVQLVSWLAEGEKKMKEVQGTLAGGDVCRTGAPPPPRN